MVYLLVQYQVREQVRGSQGTDDAISMLPDSGVQTRYKSGLVAVSTSFHDPTYLREPQHPAEYGYEVRVDQWA